MHGLEAQLGRKGICLDAPSRWLEDRRGLGSSNESNPELGAESNRGPVLPQTGNGSSASILSFKKEGRKIFFHLSSVTVKKNKKQKKHSNL